MSFGRPAKSDQGGCRVVGAVQYRPRPPSRPESRGSASGDKKWEVSSLFVFLVSWQTALLGRKAGRDCVKEHQRTYEV